MGKKWAAASQKPQKCAFCGTPHKACVEHVPSPSPPPPGSVWALGGTGTRRCHYKKNPCGGVQLWEPRYHLELPQGKSLSGSCPG